MSVSSSHLLDLLQALPVAIYTIDAAGRIDFCNDAAVELWGLRPEMGASSWCGSWRLHTPQGEPLPHDSCPMALAFNEGRPLRGAEAVLERPDGTRIPFLAFPTPLRDASGRRVGAVNMLVDISARKRAEERQTALLDELNHRVKNTVATIQALAMQTLCGNELTRELCDAFNGRLLALSRAHDLLSDGHWQSADLAAILEGALAPYRHEPARITLRGGPVKLLSRTAVTLALAFHELATNAATYGALSTARGRLHIEWETQQGKACPYLRISWRESEGPPVRPPAHTGFGTRFLERGIRAENAGRLEMTYAPEGFQCCMEIALPQPAPGPQP